MAGRKLPFASLRAGAGQILRQWSGPLTRDLMLTPGRFGLGRIPARLEPDQTTTMVCGYCSTGCGLEIHLRRGAAVNLSPAADYPVNIGMACPKGWEGLTPLAAGDRAIEPLLRQGEGAARGRLHPVTWEVALETMATRMKAIQAKHGPASVAFLSTGQIVTEEMALLGALAKFGMGMLHGDGNTRQCMATAVVAYKQAFGFDAPPYTYQDFEESDVIVLVGSNLCIAHPIMWERIHRNPHNPEIVVIDPRKTETAMAATAHYPLRPKSDLPLFYGVANLLIQRGWIDRPFIDAHTTGFEELRAHVAQFPLEITAEATGLPAQDIESLAETIHRGRRVSFWWTMGVNQSHEAVRVAQSIINLALLTGNIGRPGTGANSITGQCNAMGSRLFSNTTNLLGGHDFTNPGQRQKISDALSIPVERIPSENSLAYDQIFEAILAGKIRGLWVIATNPAHSWINQEDARDILSRLDFLVVQDMYTSTETAAMADLLLPAAGWGEKEGTFINSERRIGLVKKVARAPGKALADFHIFRLVAEAWGCGELFKRWTDPEAVFQIMKELSRGQPCDFSGIEDYRALDAAGGIQWPFPEGSTLDDGAGVGRAAAEAPAAPVTPATAETPAAPVTPATAETPAAPGRRPHPNQRRLFEDGRFFHSDGKARLIVEAPRPLPEPTSDRYPFTLLTGRGSSSQWHTQTRTSKSQVLRRLYPREIYVELSPVDARALGVEPNEVVTVVSRRASIQARAFITHAVRAGEVFIPMHYDTVNKLTFPAFDPYSRQPSYKACAVAVRRLVMVS